MTPSELISWFEGKRGRPLNPDEGLKFGDPNVQSDKVMVAWTATPDVIEGTGRWGANILLVHESPFFPYNPEEGGTSDFLTWRANLRRIALLSEFGISVVRVHGTLDELCVLDSFAELLGLPEPSVLDGLVRVYDVPPSTVGEWVVRAKQRTGMEHVRMAGDPEKVVRRVGLLWGGMGLFVNLSYMEKLVRLGCGLLICGETDAYAMRFALESGCALIETGHEVSEEFGLRKAVDVLREAFPRTEFSFYELGNPWKVV
ncbi:MAG TPA: hypothetical protein EYP61_06305 [Candidatus Latescibacteria bacterium]|nr:hypothetical protein [Candidatus Latescibacterota bacterium]